MVSQQLNTHQKYAKLCKNQVQSLVAGDMNLQMIQLILTLPATQLLHDHLDCSDVATAVPSPCLSLQAPDPVCVLESLVISKFSERIPAHHVNLEILEK